MIAKGETRRGKLAWGLRLGVFTLAGFLAFIGPVLAFNPFVLFASDWISLSQTSIPISDPEDGTSESAKDIPLAAPVGLRSRHNLCETAIKAGGSVCHRRSGVTIQFKPITLSTYSFHNGHGGPLRC